MRVFIGYELSEEAKTYLARVKGQLSKAGVQGRYTMPDNYHVTLRFLGEQSAEEIEQLEQVVDLTAARLKPFTFSLGGLGVFKKRNRYILWAGVSEGLEALQKSFETVEDALQSRGYEPSDRELNVHITLARQVKWKGSIEGLTGLVPIEQVRVSVCALTLYESTSASGTLQYIPIYQRKLGVGS